MSKISQVDDALSLLAATPNVNCDILARAVCDTAALIEPWYKATSENPAVTEIIVQVQGLGNVFYSGLDASREAAKNGYTLSQDLSTFFVHLLDKKTSEEELREHICGMIKIAARAHRKAQEVRERFFRTRREIYTVTNRIPAEVSALTGEKMRNAKKVEGARKEIRNLKIAKGCSIAGAAVVAGVSVLAFPPALLVLPVVLPLLTLVLEAREMQVAKKNEDREKRMYAYEEAIDQLMSIEGGLDKLGTFNDAFAQYWSRIETNLEIIVGRIEELRGARYRRLGLSTIKKSCEEVGKSQLDYSSKLEILELYAPRWSTALQANSSQEAGRDAELQLLVSSPSDVTLRRQNAVKRRESDESIHNRGSSRTDGLLTPPKHTDRGSHSSTSKPRSTSTSTSKEAHGHYSCRGSSESCCRSHCDCVRQSECKSPEMWDTHRSQPSSPESHKPRSRHHSQRRSERTRSPAPRSREADRSHSPSRSHQPSHDGRRSRSPIPSSRRSESFAGSGSSKRSCRPSERVHTH